MNRILVALSIPFLLTSCITDGASGSSNSIYYKSQVAADEALEAFDKANPSCQLWTNWQKMCSRTGKSGKTWCTIDPDRPVKPSTPFCTESSDGLAYDTSKKSLQQQASFRRYCIAEKGVDLEMSLADRSCAPNESKPFSGLTLTARRHPWCEAWGIANSDPKELNLVCRENGSEIDGKDCKSAATKGLVYPNGLYCAKWQVPTWCQKPEGLLGGRQIDEPHKPDSTLDILIGVAVDVYPVRGIYCAKRSVR